MQAFQSQLHLMAGLDILPIQFTRYAVEHVIWVGTAGERCLFSQQPASEVH